MHQRLGTQPTAAISAAGIRHKKPKLIVGLPLSVLHHGRLLSALVSSMARRLLATTSRSRNKEEKKETKKNSPGYLSLSCAPLGKNAGSLSDCGIKPTIAELNL